MAKNKGQGDNGSSPRGAKSAAISNYLKANNNAKPKEVVAELRKKGVRVSPNLVSVIRAKADVKKARRQATTAVANHEAAASTKVHRATAMEAAMTLYKAARGMETDGAKIRDAFLMLVDVLG